MESFEFAAGSPESARNLMDNEIDASSPEWGLDAPRGARTVLGRIIKDGANVPLFLGQTLVNSLRDVGYNHTTSAICEHVDNSIEAEATEVRVYFAETGPKNRKTFNVLVLDNGKGMLPNVLKVACAFGGSLRFGNRHGIGRYGMGMKAAALSISPVMDLYSWQMPGAYYNMTLDIAAIGQEKTNVVYLPDPQLQDTLPAEVSMVLNSPMVYPKGDTLHLFCRDAAELREKLGPSGTIVFMPDCDRLTYRKVSTLVDHAVREMSRIYRRHLDRGLKLYVNNRLVEAFDPTYQMKTARHNRIPELAGREISSRLVNRWEVQIPVSEESTSSQKAIVRLFFLPIRDWSLLSRKVLKNDLKVFEAGISFVRRDREVDYKRVTGIIGKGHTRDSWWRLEVDFPAELDEAFGVAMNKQGVRPKGYVEELIETTIADDLLTVKKAIDQFGSERASQDSTTPLSEAEQRANETEALQATLLPQPPTPHNAEEQKVLDDNLRTLAVGLKRDGETDEGAFERIKASRFVTTFKYDEDSAFYRVDFKLGKVILTINTAHPFFNKLYKPLAAVAKLAAEANSGDGDGQIDSSTAEDCSGVLISLQLVLLSLGRTQSVMIAQDGSGERQKMFDNLRKQWSLDLETQLSSA